MGKIDVEIIKREEEAKNKSLRDQNGEKDKKSGKDVDNKKLPS